MTDSMVERVARALHLGYWGDSTTALSWQKIPPNRQNEWRALARVAIEAMREPTKAMNDSGRAEIALYDAQLTSRGMAQWAVYTAMIDAALDDGTGPIPIYSGKPKD